jgi:hypothetical protein
MRCIGYKAKCSFAFCFVPFFTKPTLPKTSSKIPDSRSLIRVLTLAGGLHIQPFGIKYPHPICLVNPIVILPTEITMFMGSVIPTKEIPLPE